MAVKLKKSVNPVGTLHKVPTIVSGGTLTTPTYRVSDIVGDSKNQPSQGVLVVLAFDDVKPIYDYSPFVTLSLNVMASDCEPVSEADVFWERVGKAVPYKPE